MWGNAQGWFIAMVLLAGLVFGMSRINELGRISNPTSFGEDPANLGPVKLPMEPEKLVSMSENIDGKPLYRAAIDDYLANTSAYQRFNKSKDAGDAEQLQGLTKVRDATHADRARIFSDDPGEIVTYRDKPSLDALVALGHYCARAALLAKGEDPKAAQAWFEAEFALGAKLYEERLTVEEFNDGVELLAESAGGIARLPDAPHASEFRAFDQARLSYYKDHVEPMLKVLDSIDANVVGEHAGDIFYFAHHCAERMYRVEAIFAMGRMRFFAGENGTIGNQRGALAELKRLATDPDPIVRRAASEARDLTIEQYRFLK